MPSEATPQPDWERIGRELVAAGFDADQRGIKTYRIRGGGGGPNGWAERVPDLSDRLTAKACELWVEEVAREKFGDRVSISFSHKKGSPSRVFMVNKELEGLRIEAATGPEACLAAVRAMRAARRAGG